MKKSLLLGAIVALIASQTASANFFRVINATQNTDVEVSISCEGGWSHTWNVNRGQSPAPYKFSYDDTGSAEFDKIDAISVTYSANGKNLSSVVYYDNKNPIFNRIGGEGNDTITILVQNNGCFIKINNNKAIPLHRK